MSYIDTKIQDVPIKNTSEFRVISWSGLMHYPTADADDILFFESVDPSNRGVGKEQREYGDQRIQRIHVEGSFAEAIHEGALTAAKKKNAEEERNGL